MKLKETDSWFSATFTKSVPGKRKIITKTKRHGRQVREKVMEKVMLVWIIKQYLN